MWFLQIIVSASFIFLLFGIIVQFLGYNDELNFEPDDQDMVYPMLVASVFGIMFPGLGFWLSIDSKVSIIITSLIAIICAVFLFFGKKDKESKYIIDEKKSRNKKYDEKLKQLTNEGWIKGDIPNDLFGKSQIIISPYGKKTKLYKLSIDSKFDNYQMIKFKKSNWISFTRKLLEQEKMFSFATRLSFNETMYFKSFIVVPKLVKGAKIFYDYGDNLFHNESDQRVFMGNFESSIPANSDIEVRNGKIEKIKMNIWTTKSKDLI